MSIECIIRFSDSRIIHLLVKYIKHPFMKLVYMPVPQDYCVFFFRRGA